LRKNPITPVNHLRTWLDGLRRRATPIADVRSGYAHSVVSTWPARSEWTGKALYRDREREEIGGRPPGLA
jgi:hypothetical protein